MLDEAAFEACRWPAAVRGASFDETRRGLREWLLRHAVVKGDGVAAVADCNNFIARPWKPQDGVPIDGRRDRRGRAYQCWGPRCLFRIYTPTPAPAAAEARAAYGVLMFSSRYAASPHGAWADGGALGCVMDNVIGGATFEWEPACYMVTQELAVAEVPGRRVPLDTLLLAKVTQERVVGRKYYIKGVFCGAEGEVLCVGQAVFHRHSRLATPKVIAARHRADPEWVDTPTPFPVTALGWSASPGAPEPPQAPNAPETVFYAAVQSLASSPGALALPCEGRGWDRGALARMRLAVYALKDRTGCVGVVCFGPACLGPPPSRVNGGASFTAIDHVLRRFLPYAAPHADASWVCDPLTVWYDHGLALDTTALITVRVERASLDAVVFAAELAAVAEPPQAAWDPQALRRTLRATATFRSAQAAAAPQARL
eukprot:TRINITY_DN8151_c0_g1_i1.p1 TRINITY_DN8151_c0_g1~~TRINITY_DN8151_c0_g1_i1.p1  ORF type:complete len:428 (+),score=102.93 TRINITY_DN8151_c0_g1_i1:33-1316(+)